jgi:hypothetical protein
MCHGGPLASVVAVLIEDGSSGDLRLPGTSLGGRERAYGFEGMSIGAGIADGSPRGLGCGGAIPWVLTALPATCGIAVMWQYEHTL